MSGGRAPVDPPFVGLAVYRMRRVRDAARLLPLLGALVFALPMLWGAGGSTARGGIYVFAVWLALILASRALSQPLTRPEPAEARDGVGAERRDTGSEAAGSMAGSSERLTEAAAFGGRSAEAGAGSSAHVVPAQGASGAGRVGDGSPMPGAADGSVAAPEPEGPAVARARAAGPDGSGGA